MLKSRKHQKFIALLVGCLTLLVIILFGASDSKLNQWDFRILDFFYKQSVNSGRGPKNSSQVVYLSIDNKTYDEFGKNILNRAYLARVNNVLAELGPEMVAYDMVFSRPSRPEADKPFIQSIADLGNVYLPIAFSLSEKESPFKWEEGVAYDRLRKFLIKTPSESGESRVYHATRPLMQAEKMSEVAFGQGHITVENDPDGTYRHFPLLIKVDSGYYPALALAMFLDYVRVPLEQIKVDWGNEILIPATKKSFLEKDLSIPIDKKGNVFVPYLNTWDKDFPKMTAQSLLKNFEDINLRGNLTEFFEGKFIYVSDVSHGVSDIGQTPLEDRVPLVSIHASLMNAMLTETFYKEWSFHEVTTLMIFIAAVFGLAALPKYFWPLYTAGAGVLIFIAGLTWHQFNNFSLFPVASVTSGAVFIFSGLVIGLGFVVSKDQAFIRNAFSRYVPEKVVSELLANPETLRLGGDEKILTVLFTDLENFTSFSEKMEPHALVRLLNLYLTEMTNIVLAEGGIIDKYQGDSIMAEFGAPLSVSDHADRAVIVGLKMQERMIRLREDWVKQGYPELRCRVGINTGSMVIGNMGSDQVFDYTVMGDSVNLASRLEGANKNYGTYMMISEYTLDLLTPARFRTRVLDVIKVKGKSTAVKVYEVYGESKDTISPEDLSYYQNYEEGFEAFLAKGFSQAQEKFNKALSLRSGDRAATQMIERLKGLNPANLPEDWDGSIALTSK